MTYMVRGFKKKKKNIHGKGSEAFVIVIRRNPRLTFSLCACLKLSGSNGGGYDSIILFAFV